MGSRGPTSKPTVLKVLEGNPGKRPLPKNEPQPESFDSVPRPPSFLMPLAKKHWKTLGEDLRQAGLLTKVDLDAFAACCNAYATWVDAMGQLKKHGMLVKSPNGYPMPSPYIGIAEKALNRMLQYQKEFGLTPAARARVEVEPDADDGDALDRLIDGREATG